LNIVPRRDLADKATQEETRLQVKEAARRKWCCRSARMGEKSARINIIYYYTLLFPATRGYTMPSNDTVLASWIGLSTRTSSVKFQAWCIVCFDNRPTSLGKPFGFLEIWFK
jgi:hypothetical protein